MEKVYTEEQLENMSIIELKKIRKLCVKQGRDTKLIDGIIEEKKEEFIERRSREKEQKKDEEDRKFIMLLGFLDGWFSKK